MLKSFSRMQFEAERAKRGPRQQPEHDQQVLFFAILDLNLSLFPALTYAFAIPNGGHRAKAVAAKLKAEGVKAGVSDIFVPIPARGYHGLFIEMKAGKNNLSKPQREFGNFVADRGYSFYAAWSAAEAVAALEIYLGVKLKKFELN